jgi:hypothetical protein
MDTHTQNVTGTGSSQATTQPVKPQPGLPSNVLNEIGQVKTTQQSTGKIMPQVTVGQIDSSSHLNIKPIPSKAVPPTHNGHRLRELGVFLPVVYNLIMGRSSEQITRVFYFEGEYICGPNKDKVGISRLVSVDVRPGEGVHLIFSTGHRVDIPDSLAQVTYVYE